MAPKEPLVSLCTRVKTGILFQVQIVDQSNLLSLMGLAPPDNISDEFDALNLANYKKGDYVSVLSDGTKWQALTDNPSAPPSADSNEWLQVIEGVARSMSFRNWKELFSKGEWRGFNIKQFHRI